MSVTGHRSINSLSVYKKVSANEKIAMGMAMTAFLKTDMPQQQQIQQKAIAPCKGPHLILPKPQEIAVNTAGT